VFILVLPTEWSEQTRGLVVDPPERVTPIGIKPISESTGSTYNTNNAGTQEAFLAYFQAGATGSHRTIGSSKYTGMLSRQGAAYYQAYLLNE
jgi:hypothetical protein